MSEHLVAQMQNRVNKHGLVPMRIEVQNFTPYMEGAIHGFPPEEAARLVSLKAAVPVDVKGEPDPVVEPKKQAAQQEPPKPSVAIPDDWRDLHHFKRIRLAAELEGRSPEGMTADQADTIIAGHVAMRGPQQSKGENDDGEQDEAGEPAGGA